MDDTCVCRIDLDELLRIAAGIGVVAFGQKTVTPPHLVKRGMVWKAKDV